MATAARINRQLLLSQRATRILSILVLIGIGVGYPLGAWFMAPDGEVPIQLMPLQLIGLFSALILFLDGRGMITAGVTARLDERERAMRDRAYVTTHQIMVITMVAYYLWSQLAPHVGAAVPGPAQAHELLTAFAIVAMAMPGMIMAWRERPLTETEESDA